MGTLQQHRTATETGLSVHQRKLHVGHVLFPRSNTEFYAIVRVCA